MDPEGSRDVRKRKRWGLRMRRKSLYSSFHSHTDCSGFDGISLACDARNGRPKCRREANRSLWRSSRCIGWTGGGLEKKLDGQENDKRQQSVESRISELVHFDLPVLKGEPNESVSFGSEGGIFRSFHEQQLTWTAHLRTPAL